MNTRESIVGKLMACYWPNAEPKVVVVLGVSPADECLVQIANSTTMTGALIEYLREFDRDDFDRAHNAYWRDEYARRSERYALLAIDDSAGGAA